MINKKIQYLKTMGIDVWIRKIKSQTIYDLDEIQQKVSKCKLCSLHKNRHHTVFGTGNKNTKIMFVGEAPGANEDLYGEPFVGAAGLLFNKQLKAINLDRKDIYITNILKCRPTNNRTPIPEEIKYCTIYLLQQINIIKPEILVCLGKTAAQFFLNSNESIGNLRLNTHQYKINSNKILLFVTYHPSYLLRSPYKKKESYIDFLSIKHSINMLHKL